MTDFNIKAYTVSISGYAEHDYFAETQASARAKAFDSYRSVYNNVTFKDFLKIGCKVYRSKNNYSLLGEKIKINYLDNDNCDAFCIKQQGNTIWAVRPNSNLIFTVHEMDVDFNFDRKGFIVVRSNKSILTDCPENTPVTLSTKEGVYIEGVWRYYLKGNNNEIDCWSVDRGSGYYSELPPMGVELLWNYK